MGCKNTKLSSSSNTAKSNSDANADQLNDLFLEFNLIKISTCKNSSSKVVAIKKSVREDQPLLLLVKDEIANSIAALKLLGSLKTSLPEFDEEAEFIIKNPELIIITESIRAQLFEELASLCIRQKSMLTALRSKKKEIREKMRRTKWKKKLRKVLCNIIFVSMLLVSFALAAITAPPVAVTAVVAGGCLIKAAEQWSHSVQNHVLSMLEEEEEVVEVMMKGETVGATAEMERSLRAMAMEKMKRRSVEEEVEGCAEAIKKRITKLMAVITGDL